MKRGKCRSFMQNWISPLGPGLWSKAKVPNYKIKSITTRALPGSKWSSLVMKFMQRPWPSDHLARDGGNPAPYSHFLYSLRLIIRVDGKKPGLIDCTKRNWENSCSLCFLQVMRLIRGARIITNFRGSFPAVGDRPCRQIFFGNYNRGLYCLPMPIYSAFYLFRARFSSIWSRFEMHASWRWGCQTGGGNKECPISSRYARDTSLDMPRISWEPIRKISSRVVPKRDPLEVCCNCQLMARPPHISTQRQLQLQPIWYLLRLKSNFIV